MKSTALLVAAASLALAACSKSDSAGHGDHAATPAATSSASTHPMRGVVVDVLADQSALLVKHEPIPGVMPAMTMLFQVDASTLQAAQKGRTITGRISEKDGAWLLTDVNAAGN